MDHSNTQEDTLMLAGPQAVTLIGEGPMEDTHPDRATLGRQGDLLPLAAHPRHPHTPPPHNPTSNTRKVEHQPLSFWLCVIFAILALFCLLNAPENSFHFSTTCHFSF